MAFARKTLLGLTQAISSLKSWCNNTFALKGHTHSELAIQGVRLTKRYTKSYDGIIWTIEEYSDNYVVMRACRIPNLYNNTSNANRLYSYLQFVNLPITMADTNYQIIVTPRVKIGTFSLGRGLCGYGLSVDGPNETYANNAIYKQTKVETTKFTLLACAHYTGYDVLISGNKAV